MAQAVLYRVIWPVDDIDRAAAFYGAVLEDPGERVSAGRHYMACGATVLALYDPVADTDGRGEGWRHHEKGYIYFAVPDLAAARERVLAAGGRHVTLPETYPWGETAFYAADPFGNPIAFVDDRTLFRGGAYIG